MSTTDVEDWRVVALFLAGDLDHSDYATRMSIAGACARLDASAGVQPRRSPDEWELALCHVATEER